MLNLAYMWKKSRCLFVPVFHAALPSGDASVHGSEKQEVGRCCRVSTHAHNVMPFQAKMFVSFPDEWWVRISITIQYNNIYVII